MMNLISCNQCGTVLDKEKLIFPSTHHHDYQTLIEENVKWNGSGHVAFINCPVCSAEILETNE